MFATKETHEMKTITGSCLDLNGWAFQSESERLKHGTSRKSHQRETSCLHQGAPGSRKQATLPFWYWSASFAVWFLRRSGRGYDRQLRSLRATKSTGLRRATHEKTNDPANMGEVPFWLSGTN